MKLLPRRRRLVACFCWAAFIPLLAGAQEGAGIPAATIASWYWPRR